MNFQWYPGHMTKAKRQMQEDIKLIDLVIELVDARIPLSSRNPDIDELGKNKARLILMNKSDLADEEAGKLWSAYFQKKGYYVVSLDSRNRNGMKQVTAVVMEACKEKIERDRKRGIMNRPVRAMVVGIPNVGKSTFINSYAGKACAKTGNKPGVTKGKQWIRLNKNVELLDTPGILWPKFEDQQVGLRLALIGSIRDEILNQDVALQKGPMASLLKSLSWLQNETKDLNVLRTAIVTARNKDTGVRVIKTLRAWNIVVDEVFFMQGAKKADVLACFGANIFFDDQDVHAGPASDVVPSARVPYKEGEM